MKVATEVQEKPTSLETSAVTAAAGGISGRMQERLLISGSGPECFRAALPSLVSPDVLDHSPHHPFIFGHESDQNRSPEQLESPTMGKAHLREGAQLDRMAHVLHGEDLSFNPCRVLLK